MVPQWQNLMNDFTNDLNRGRENKLKSPSKVIPPIDRAMVQSPESMIIKNPSTTNKVTKNRSSIRESKNSSLTLSNKSKSKSLSLHKLNKSGSITIEKNKKKNPSKRVTSNYSHIIESSNQNNKSKIKDKPKKKKSTIHSVNKSISSVKNNSKEKTSLTDTFDHSSSLIKNLSKDNSNSSNSINSNNSKSHSHSFHSDHNSSQDSGSKILIEDLSNQSSHSSSTSINKSQKILSSNGSLSGSFISILNEDKDKEENDNNKIISYPITSYQLGIFNRIDSLDTNKRKRNSFYYTVQCYQVDKSLNSNIMKRVVDVICDKYAILKTRFYRNNKIIDANVEAIIDEKTFYNKVVGNYKNIKNYKIDFSYFEEVRLKNYPKLVTLSASSIQHFVENWINSNPVFENQFKVFMFSCGKDKDWEKFKSNQFSMNDDSTNTSSSSIDDVQLLKDGHYININNNDDQPKTFISIVGSIMIADEISLNAIMCEIMSLYSHEEMKNGGDTHLIHGDHDYIFENYKSKEDNFCFINYAQEQKENRDKTKVSLEKIKSFWKKQCTEVNNDILLPKERKDMTEQVKKLKEELKEKKEKYNHIGSKKNEYKTTIEKLTYDRIQLEKGNGSVATVIDPVNGERLEISNEAKQVILKMISGSETTSTIEPFLIKHEVSEHVRKCIHSSMLKIEDFASLSDKDLEQFQLDTSDHRKIAALVEYVRNRIRECIQGHSKVKISLERHLSKAQREYDRCVKDYEKYEKMIEKISKEIIKINSILHPPLKISNIPVMQLQGVRQKSVIKNDWGEYNLYYGFMPLHLESDQNQYFQTFFDDWKNKYYKEYRVERCLRKKMEREKNELVNLEDAPLVEPDYDYLSDDDIYSSSENVVNSFYNNMPSTEAICLAIFSVLLRHISGIEKFLIGVHQSQRRIYQAGDCIIGSLSNIIPIKIDLSHKGVTFYNHFADLIFSIKKSRKTNADHSYAQLFDCPDLPEELPVQFEFINKEECELWRKMGLKMEDLFSGFNRNQGWTKNDVDFSSSSTSRSSSFASSSNSNEALDAEFLKYHPKIKQLWSSNISNTFIFKLIMVEWDDDTIEGGILYSRNHFDEDQITKWVSKFETLIENIELGKPKVTVANLISRLYQNLRWKGSQMLLSSSMMLYDKRKTMTTSLLQLSNSKKDEDNSSNSDSDKDSNNK